MSEFKGTPGPWVWAEGNRGLYGPGPGFNSAVLAFYQYEGLHLADKTDKVQEANANLIAAAPDIINEAIALIDRLSSFESDLEDDHVAREFYGHVSPAIANMKYAIAKALGEK